MCYDTMVSRYIEDVMREKKRILFEAAIVCKQGKKEVMEDAYYFADLKKDGSTFFGGVYDGHGGNFAAIYAKKNLHKIFFEERKKGGNEKDAFGMAYKRISQILRDQESGAVAVNFYIKDGRLFYANAGDAKLLVVREKDTLQLSRDHRLTNPREKARIRKTGALIEPPYVVKRSYGLMPTRSLGDAYFWDVGVIATPETGSHSLRTEDRWILAATDGLTDYMKNEEIASFLHKYKNANEAARALKTEVLEKRGGTDNLTFILLKRIL